MRLFQILLSPVETYDWARGNETYEATYKNQIAQADVQIAERKALLERLGLDQDIKVPVVVTTTQMVDLNIAKVSFEVIRELRPGQDDRLSPADFMDEFRAVAEKLLAAPAVLGYDVHSAYNQKCEVHMPGQALSTYNDLMLKQDTCTDELQGELDRGWRIIAVCPQPDQRRPDYILGRFNPQNEVGGGAHR